MRIPVTVASMVMVVALVLPAGADDIGDHSGSPFSGSYVYGLWPAGTTNAVLSFIDGAGAHVSVNRHWPRSPQDVQVFPYTPYFWDGCLPFQAGALMFLLTTPMALPVPAEATAEAYTARAMASLGHQLTNAVQQGGAAPGLGNLQATIAQMTTPGTPSYEALKAALPLINSIGGYEDYGYSVFLFVTWSWVWVPFPVPVPCSKITIVSVPEGWGIPYVS